jgi:putative transposase
MYDRIEADKYYHIFSQANGMIDIFKESRNYPFFIDKMENHLSPVCDMLAFCLMKDHFHLVIKTKELEESEISEALAALWTDYENSYNKAYNRSGSLFQAPFKRKLIASETYLKNVILYVHSNPFIERDFVLELFNDSTNFVATHRAFQLNTSFTPTFE